jgi:SAM-dependent methyltransferase
MNVFKFDGFRPELKISWNGISFNSIKNSNLYEFSENFSGWSDDLTVLHEHAIGSGHPIDIYGRSITVEIIRSHAKSNKVTVLEIGCSSGYLLSDVQFIDNINYIGSDIVGAPLVRLASKYPKNPFIRCDILNSPFCENSVDIVVALNVLEHIDDDYGAVEQICKILNPGGILIIELPFNQNLYDSFDKSLFHFRRYSLDRVKNLAAKSGMKITAINYTGILIYPIFYLYKKFFSKVLKLKPEDEIKNSGNSRLFNFLLMLEKRISILNVFNAGIRIRAVLKK